MADDMLGSGMLGQELLGGDPAVATTITASDSATGSDTASPWIAPAAVDAGNGDDGATLSSGLLTADASTGLDDGSAAAAQVGTDTGSGADLAALAIAAHAEDSATSFEVAASAVTTAAADVVTAVEDATVDTGPPGEVGPPWIPAEPVATGEVWNAAEGAALAVQVGDGDSASSGESVLGIALTASPDVASSVEDQVVVAETPPWIPTQPGTSGEVWNATSGAAPPTQVTGGDTATGADAATLTVQTLKTGNDTGTGSDDATVATQQLVGDSDSATGTDSHSVLQTTQISSGDAGTGLDGGQLVAAQTSADSATGTETATKAQLVGSSDSATGVEVAVIRLSSGDTATGTDSGTATKPQLDSEIIAVVETASLVKLAFQEPVLVPAGATLSFDL